MKGVRYITDDRDRRKAVVIDIATIEKHPDQVEDLIDVIIAESRKKESKRDWKDVKKEILGK
jgi:hypothetical protein